jgi:hypothetical protein
MPGGNHHERRKQDKQPYEHETHRQRDIRRHAEHVGATLVPLATEALRHRTEAAPKHKR